MVFEGYSKVGGTFVPKDGSETIVGPLLITNEALRILLNFIIVVRSRPDKLCVIYSQFLHVFC